MNYEDIAYEVSEGVGTLTLNRPEKLNAWTMRMGFEVEHALNAASADPAVRVIVITGAGKAFCAGADLSLLRDISGSGEKVESADPPDSAGWPVAFNLQLPTLSKPVIAAVNGHAVGMGFALALCCDLRYASSTAKFATVFSKLGLIAEYGLAWILPRLIGLPASFDLLYSSRTVDAPEALSLGLVNALFPVKTFAEDVRREALQLTSAVSPRSLSIMRRQLYDATSQTFAEAAKVADAEMRRSLQDDEFKEGLAAFSQKRAPKFQGGAS